MGDIAQTMTAYSDRCRQAKLWGGINAKIRVAYNRHRLLNPVYVYALFEIIELRVVVKIYPCARRPAAVFQYF